MACQISVIMPLRNAAVYLAETLRSYRDNASPRMELLVVDDGSTDQSLAVLQQSGLAHRLFHACGVGPAAARNLALGQAEGLLTAFLDADDLWPRQTLARLAGVLHSQPQVRICAGRIQTFSTGEVAPEISHRLRAQAFYGVNLGAALFYTEDLRRLGGFDETLRFDEDTDLWIRCWEQGLEKRLIADTTLMYRLHSDNMTRQIQNNALALLPLLKRRRDRRSAGEESKPTQQSLAHYLGWLAPEQGFPASPQQ